MTEQEHEFDPLTWRPPKPYCLLTTAQGEWLRQRFKGKHYYQDFGFGVRLGQVLYADCSNTSGLMLYVHCAWWHWRFSLVRWQTPWRRHG